MHESNDRVPLSLCTLAMEIDQEALALERQVAKERAEAEWRTKKRPTIPQAPPCGLFEQTQGSLF